MIAEIRWHTAVTLSVLALATLAGCRSGGVFAPFGNEPRIEARVMDVEALPDAIYRVQVRLSNEGRFEANVDPCFSVQWRVAGAWVNDTRVVAACELNPRRLLSPGADVMREALLNLEAFTPAEIEDTAFRLVFNVMRPGDTDFTVQPAATGAFSVRFLD